MTRTVDGERSNHERTETVFYAFNNTNDHPSKIQTVDPDFRGEKLARKKNVDGQTEPVTKIDNTERMYKVNWQIA